MEQIDRMIAESEKFDERKEGLDFKVRPTDIEWDSDGKHVAVPVLGGGKMSMVLEPLAWEHVYRKLAPA